MAKITKKVNVSEQNQYFDYQKYKWLVLTGLFVLSFLLYSNTLSHDYALDDLIVTTDNPLVLKGIDGIGEIVSHGYFYANTGRNDESYRPLSMVMIAIETEFFGLNPAVYHLLNVLFYSFTIVLLFLLLKIIFKNKNIFVPLIISILFLAHPIHTEVVANIKSRDEIMQLFFIILSLLLLFSYIKNQQFLNTNNKTKNKFILFILSVLCYFLALLSKEIAITFLAIIPLLLFFFTDTKIKKIAIYTIPFLVGFILYFILRMSILDNMSIDKQISIYENSLFATTSIIDFFATNMTIHLKYLQLLIFPHPLSWDYSFNQIPIVTLSNPKVILSILIFIAMITYAIYSFKKKNPISFSILYYLITISIVSNFVVQLAWTMGERFIYTASLGYIIFIVIIFHNLIKKIKTNDFNKTVIVLILVATLTLLYSYKTISRNKEWKNNFTIYQSGILSSPNSARAHSCLADTYRLKIDEANTKNDADTYLQNAIEGYEKAIEIYPENPSVYYSFGHLYYTINQYDKALSLFQTGVGYDSLHVDMLNYIGIIHTKNNDFENGEKYFKKVLSIEPDFKHALKNLEFINQQKK